MNWIKQCEQEAKALTPDLRQQVLDDLWAGLSIGKACDKHSLTLAAVCGVLQLNIVGSMYLSLNTKSV